MAGDEAEQTSSPPTRETGAEAGEVISEGDERDAPEYELQASRVTVGRNYYDRNMFNIGGDYIVSGDGTAEIVQVADITRDVGDLGGTFVEPACFGSVVDALHESRMVLITGRNCGNRITAAAALRATGHRPILELPAGVSAKALVDRIEQVCRSKREPGFLVYSLDADTLAEFSGFELRRLRGVLPEGAAAVLTAQVDGREPSGELPTVAGRRPDLEAVVRAHAGALGAEPDAGERALAAVRILGDRASPSMAVELIELAVGSEVTGKELAALVVGNSRVLDEWLAGRPTAQAVGCLAAAATLDGVPLADFETAAAELSTALEGEVELPSAGRRFGPVDMGLPPEVVSRSSRSIPTHFGSQETEVVEIAPPHRDVLVLIYLWRHLGSDFRAPYLTWLRSLAGSTSWRVAQAAARSAGFLFSEDPIATERELLRSWALSESSREQDCAAMALGVPVATGADPTAARLLAKTWAGGRGDRLRRVAVIAYGGPLGVWDPGAAAPGQLWRIPARSPGLRHLADRSLASLVTGGADAARVRAAVISLLRDQAETRQARARAFSILPLVFGRLTRPTGQARASLAALTGGSESGSLGELATILVMAFDAPAGYEHARSAVEVVLRAMSRGAIDGDAVGRLLAEIHAAGAAGDRLPRLEAQLGRVLRAQARGKGRMGEVARSVQEEFHEQGQGGRLVSN